MCVEGSFWNILNKQLCPIVMAEFATFRNKSGVEALQRVLQPMDGVISAVGLPANMLDAAGHAGLCVPPDSCEIAHLFSSQPISTSFGFRLQK